MNSNLDSKYMAALCIWKYVLPIGLLYIHVIFVESYHKLNYSQLNSAQISGFSQRLSLTMNFKLSTIIYLVQIQLNCMTKGNISNLSEFTYIQKLYRRL